MLYEKIKQLRKPNEPTIGLGSNTIKGNVWGSLEYEIDTGKVDAESIVKVQSYRTPFNRLFARGANRDRLKVNYAKELIK